MKDTVLFDLGNTLVRYFEKTEFDAILRESIEQVRGYLNASGLPSLSPEETWRRVEAENHESPDGRVRPLEGRLSRIFALDPQAGSQVMEAMCHRFLQPFYARAQRYEDTLPTLVKAGATIGAGCIIGNDLSIGRFAMVGMGSLVTKDVDDFHLVIGHPAKPVGCVCRCGHLVVRFADIVSDTKDFSCPACGLTYRITGQVVEELDPPS